MNEPNPDTNTAGSQWRRWDPHIHSPGTKLNDQFGGDWETFLQKLESAAPAIHALGITDYCSIQGYRTVRAYQRDGRLQNIGLIFPNVEFRLDVKTEKAKGINLHLLFSPHDSDQAQCKKHSKGHGRRRPFVTTSGSLIGEAYSAVEKPVISMPSR